MKPQNKFQEYVVELSSKLSGLTKTQKRWASKNMFEKLVFKTTHTATCFECSHTWKEETTKKKHYICPNCNEKLVVSNGQKRKITQFKYFDVITVVKGIQVVRQFSVIRYYYKGYPVEYHFSEVYQHWFSPCGKKAYLAVYRTTFSYTKKIPWQIGSKMSIKLKKEYCFTEYVYPKKQILPEIIRNGYNGERYNLDMSWLFECFLYKPLFEILVKAHQYELVTSFHTYEESIKKYWQQIRICNKHKYIIAKGTWNIYKDYIDLLTYFKKDHHNPHYVCPKDLKAEHDKLVKKKKQIERIEKIVALKAKIEEEDKIYKERFKNFLGLKFEKDNYTICLLNSVEDFLKEADEMEHCIFENEYYKKNSLMFTSFIDRKKAETIEFDLNNFQVVQSYGINNTITEHHDNLIKIVNSQSKKLKKLKKYGICINT